MDVFSALLTCSLSADEPLARAIAFSNARGNVYSVMDPTSDPQSPNPPPDPTTEPAALERIAQIRAERHTPLVGLLLVPLAWAEFFGRTPVELFDPCVNISVGSAMLSAFEADCRSAFSRRRSPTAIRALKPSHFRACVLRRYEQEIRLPDFMQVVLLQLDHQPPLNPRISRAPVFIAPHPRSWGADRLLFSTPALPP